MEIYRRDDLVIRKKQDSSPVTEADEAADRLISAGLTAGFPGLPLVTEEQSATHDLSARTFLIVDPLDGTKEFVRRRGRLHCEHRTGRRRLPGVGRCLCAGEEAAVPDLAGRRGDRGNGRSGRGQGPGDTRLIRVVEPDNAALRVVASKSHRDQATDDYIAKYEVADSGERRLVAQVLPCGDRRGGLLPAAWPDDGVGHGRWPCHFVRCRGEGGLEGDARTPRVWQAVLSKPRSSWLIRLE